ncbi:MAG: TAXI family TRAP transporter solute-binding subunit, partial [Gammaproteobacteria bacterium]|nr:TAXI family TRAP transporter solute-binding subunit [Gammaproteobacteria bacterium]
MTFGAYAVDPQNIQIITLPTGSKAYRVGVTLAASINRSTDHKAIVAGYGGAQVIVPMLQTNRAELALINSDDATQGYRGTGQFRRTNDNLRLVSNAYDIFAGVVVAADSAIETIEDIKGKRVTGIFSSHKSCELVARAQMANMGLDRREVRTVPVTNPISSVQAVAEGRADVALCVSPGIPAALEANAKVGIRYISMDPSESALSRQKQIFTASNIVLKKTGIIPDISEDGYFLSYDYYLVTSSHVPDHVVEDVLT